MSRNLVRALAASAVALTISWTRSASAQIDYTSNLGALFAADYQDTGSGPQPQNNPFGDWRFLAKDGTTTGLVSKPGGLGASGQAGWENNPTQGGPWTYFANSNWMPGINIHPAVVGHAPQQAVWTAPASVNAGGISIAGSFEQIFRNDPVRVERLSIFKNGSATADFTVDSVPPPDDSGLLLTKVDFSKSFNIAPGDTLKFSIDGSGTGGSGVVTFVAWNVVLTETAAIPEPATVGMLMLGVLRIPGWRRRQAA
jgi:hypothetical protein